MKQKEKTIKDYLNTLKEPHKTKALNNTKRKELSKQVDNKYQALMYAFDWSDSKEGFEYWSEVYENL